MHCSRARAHRRGNAWLRTAGPRFAVRTNALYWATASLNAGFEVGLDPRTSWEVAGGYNPWTFGDNRNSDSGRRRPNSATGSAGVSPGIFGLHVLYADFNAGGVKLFGMGDRRYEGFLYGAGLSYGYQWVVGRRWNIEAMLGVGYIRSEYDRYVWKRCGRFLGSGRRNYFGPTRVGVSVGFMIR